uniref:Uncharacterized protein n=1 Tax=Oryza rufipogon TaxID=4529 RepID=A0A0E0QWW7_ORYRU
MVLLYLEVKPTLFFYSGFATAVVYPVRRSVAPPAVQHLGDVLGQCNCGAPGCPEMIPAQAQFCCLRCKAAD